jgi:glycine/serine hydroxymethyltransferase
MDKIAELIDHAIARRTDDSALTAVRAEVRRLTDKFPIYKEILQAC